MLNIVERVKKGAAPMLFATILVAAQPMTATYATTSETTTPPQETVKQEEVKEATTPTATAEPTTQKAAPTPVKKQTGPKKPNGAAANTYKQNPETGAWENEHYSWDPATGKTAPKKEQNYSYNPETGMWETKKWKYDAASGKYVPNIVSSPTGPNGEKSKAAQDVQPLNTASSTNGIDEAGEKTSDNKNSDDKEDIEGSKRSEEKSSGGGFFDSFFNGSISSKLDSNATTGDASVIGNTTGGSATSGDARAIANIVNLLQSSWGWTGDLMTFIADVYGDVFGDLVIDPGKASESAKSSGSNPDIDINAENNASINNEVNLTATSGNANVKNNTSAGDATSGDATALANIVNLINSSISAGDSFLGMINIHGNLNGDILLPPEMLKQLKAIASSSSESLGDVDISSTTNQSIKNDVKANASSGDANVKNNTSAGSATSGDAENQLTILNMTGRQVIGDNALLVFVNVFGKWVGMIVDAPAGSTSAALGNGITQNQLVSADKVNLDEVTNHQINNNVNVNAHTGDANVESNTEAGNATTGDALTGVNIANISNSQLALTNWFGILFINVFGEWEGSFGMDTSAGERPAPVVKPNTSSPKLQKNGSDDTPSRISPELAALINNNTSIEVSNSSSQSATSGSANVSGNTVASSEEDAEKTVTLAASTRNGGNSGGAATAAENANWMFSAVGFLIGASLIAAERIISMRQSRQRLNAAV